MTTTQEALRPTENAADLKIPLLNWLKESRKNGLITLFDDATPVIGDPLHANKNVLEAIDLFMKDEINSVEPLLIIGSMGNGKSTLTAKIYQTLTGIGKTVEVYSHINTNKNFFIQAGEKGMIVEEIDSKQYKGVDDLINKIDWKKAEYVLIDEFNFAFEGKEDPPQADREKVRELFNKAKQHDVKLVISTLHSDFRGIMWPNMLTLLEFIPKIYELQGICDTKGCSNPSVLTSRKTVIKMSDDNKEIVRDSHYNEKVCRPGTVIKNTDGENLKELKDKYQRCCAEEGHHTVCDPYQARQFDLKHGVNTDDY